MKVGWLEAMQTPYEVIMQDLEYMQLEAKYGQAKPDKPAKQRGK